jgi:hypothetical protein
MIFHPKPSDPMRFLFLFALFALLSAQDRGCGRRGARDAETAGPLATAPRSAKFLAQKLPSKLPEGLRYLNASARIHVEGQGQSVSANANLIWIRDSVIWLNVRKLGIEAARVLITRDSVIALNRLEKTYRAQAMEALQRDYNLPAGFALLQHTLLASAWVADNMPLEADTIEGAHRLRGNNGQLGAEYRLEEGRFLLRREVFVQQMVSRIISLDFEGYKKTPENQWFPYLRRVEAFSPETGQLRLDIEFSDLELNVPKNYRFEIPEHYERQD